MRDYSVASIKKAMDILEFLKNEKKATFAQIQSGLGFAKSSTYQILKTLEYAHYISANEYGEYTLGYKLYELGSAFGQNISWRNVIAPFIRDIAEKTEMTIHVSILTKSLDAICLEKIPGKIFTMQLTEVGTPLQMNTSASGKVLLAWLPDSLQEQVLDRITYTAFTAYSITSKEELHKELLAVKQKGYALDNRESEENCRGVAVPLLACNGSLLASISAGAPISLMEEEQMLSCVKILQEYAEKMAPLLMPDNL